MKAIIVLLLALSVGSIYAATYPSTCFFSVTAKNGVWWFVDPNGKPFISKGVDCVTPYGDTGTDGTAIFKEAVISKYSSNTKYDDYYYAWAADTAAQLTSWNMNTFGAWGNSYIYNQSLAFTTVLNFASRWATASGSTYMFPDVFNPGFATLSATIATSLYQYINNPYLLGYFLDNELFWGNDWRGQYSLMAMYLNQTGSYGYARAQTFLKAKYSTIALLKTSWGITSTSVTSFDTLKWGTYSTSNANYIVDANNFLTIVATQYYNVTTSAIRKVDPNHLILGTKHVGLPSDYVLAAEGKYVDVISFDYYGSTLSVASLAAAYTVSKRPLFVAEFSFRASDSGLPNTSGGGPLVATQTLRADGFQSYVQTAIASPYLIGFNWFQWADQPSSGRAQDGEDSNMGLVSNSNVPWSVLTTRMKTVYGTLDALHGTTPSLTATCRTSLTCPNDCSGHGCCNTKTGTCTCDSDYSGLACESFVGSFTDSFTSFSAWTNQSGFNNGAMFYNQSVLTLSSSGLNIPVSTTGCPSLCNGKSAVSSGIKSVLAYQYGRFDFNFKFANKVAIPITISWQESDFKDGDGVQLSLDPSNPYLVFQRWVNGSNYVWNQVYLSFDPSAAYHTYSIVKPRPTSANDIPTMQIYADSTLITNLTTSVPVTAGQIWINYYSASLPSSPTTSLQLKQVKYTAAASRSCSTFLSAGYYTIKNLANSLYLDGNTGSATQVDSTHPRPFLYAASSGSEYQQWYVQQVGDYYTIKCKANSKYLDANTAVTQYSADLPSPYLWPTATTSQYFNITLVSTSPVKYIIGSPYNNGKTLDGNTATSQKDSYHPAPFLYTLTMSNYQQWIFTAV